ncbi:unnamed protein product [Dibothriocephalus latus]|uniref:Uncharacterized protein n=1 Tax=Dibothriocephalus latus TaxID=60516 RepID=A0A3P7L3M1_DIBLA|nr:unnamed protein product [Dibothriocephalus latus]
MGFLAIILLVPAPPGTRDALEVVQEPAALDARTTQVIQLMHRNLDVVNLDLPAFEGMVQGLARTPPDDATLRQLQATADRLQDLERRLEAYIGPLTGSIKEKKATLDELMQLTPSGSREAPAVVQEPPALDARTTQLMQAIRQNLDLVALDLPAFEVMVQGLACTPPDDVTLRQLHVSISLNIS